MDTIWLHWSMSPVWMLSCSSARVCVLGFEPSLQDASWPLSSQGVQNSNQRCGKQQGSQQWVYFQGQAIRWNIMMKNPKSDGSNPKNPVIIDSLAHFSGNLSEVHATTEPFSNLATYQFHFLSPSLTTCSVLNLLRYKSIFLDNLLYI